MKPVKLELHIEELILEGFAPESRHLIARAVEGELSRLFAEQGIPSWMSEGGEVARLDGGAFQSAPGSRPQATGVEIAQAVYGRLSR